MSDWYRRDGTKHQIPDFNSDKEAWSKAMHQIELDLSNPALKVVARTSLPNGKLVSTVWLGLNYNHDDGAPMIFETMVFPGRNSYNDLDMERYSTESEALAGHQRMVAKWRRVIKRAIS